MDSESNSGDAAHVWWDAADEMDSESNYERMEREVAALGGDRGCNAPRAQRAEQLRLKCECHSRREAEIKERTGLTVHSIDTYTLALTGEDLDMSSLLS